MSALRFIAANGMLEPGFFVLYGDSYLPIEYAPVWQTSDQGRVCTMTVLHNAGQWDSTNVLLRDGAVLLYEKGLPNPAAIGMQHIDYGLSVLTRSAIVNGIRPDEVVDLAALLNRLSLSGHLRAYEVFQWFFEIGSSQGLDDFEAYVARTEHGASGTPSDIPADFSQSPRK